MEEDEIRTESVLEPQVRGLIAKVKGVVKMGELSLREELDDIRNTVHLLETTKQNKVPLGIVITLVLWSASMTVSGVWWAAALSSQMTALAEKVVEIGEDRYYGRQATSDFTLRDQRDEYILERVGTLGKELDKLNREIDQLREQVNKPHAPHK